MIITKKIVKIGCSLGIIIDKSIMEGLNLQKGNFVEIKIKKINREDGQNERNYERSTRKKHK